MTREEIDKYYSVFNDVHEWAFLTEDLDRQTISSIKKQFIKQEIYTGFDFNTDHLEAIEKIQVEKTESPSWNGGSAKTIYATFDRICSTVELKITENEKEVYKNKVRVSEAYSESYFRDLEKLIDKKDLEKESKKPDSYMLDATTYKGVVTWFKNDSVSVCKTGDRYVFGEDIALHADILINDARRMIVETIDEMIDF